MAEVMQMDFQSGQTDQDIERQFGHAECLGVAAGFLLYPQELVWQHD
jgi:hypothetical protein